MLCTTSVDRYVVLAYELYTYIYETSDNILYNTIELDRRVQRFNPWHIKLRLRRAVVPALKHVQC